MNHTTNEYIRTLALLYKLSTNEVMVLQNICNAVDGDNCFKTKPLYQILTQKNKLDYNVYKNIISRLKKSLFIHNVSRSEYMLNKSLFCSNMNQIKSVTIQIKIIDGVKQLTLKFA
jgi:hypothetical protein